MTTMQANKDPEVFLTQVNDLLEEIQEKIDEFLDKSADLFDGAIRAITTGGPGAIKGAIKGFFSGGPFGVGPGAVQGAIDAMLEDYEKGCNDINGKWEELQESVRMTIGSILGDPLQMSKIASNYRDVVEKLGNHGNEIKSANSYVALSWQGGRAHQAYVNTSDYQLEALSAVVATLDNAAQLMDDHQVMLIQYWSDQLNNLVKIGVALTNEISDLADAGNWLSAGVGPIVRAFSESIGGAADILTTFINYWAELNIGMAGDWDGLQAMIPESGLENNVWPDFTNVDSSQINQPW